MKLLLVILASVFWPTAASAADWQMFLPNGASPHRHIWFVDRSSVRNIESNKSAWVEMINENPDEKQVVSMKALIEINCNEKRSRFLAIEMFSSDKLIADKETPGDWRYIPPDSPIDTLSSAICSGDYGDAMEVTGSPEIMARAAFDVVDNNGNLRRAKKR